MESAAIERSSSVCMAVRTAGVVEADLSGRFAASNVEAKTSAANPAMNLRLLTNILIGQAKSNSLR